MKSVLLSACVFLLFLAQTQAQTEDTQWQSGALSSAETKPVVTLIENVFQAMNARNFAKASSFYTLESAIISVDGALAKGKDFSNIDWQEFAKRFPANTKFEYKNLEIRMLTKDLALAVYDASMTFDQNGAPAGMHSKGADLIRNTNGQWKIEFEQMTLLQPPAENK